MAAPASESEGRRNASVRRVLVVEGAAKNLNAFFEFERALLADPYFGHPEPDRHQTMDNREEQFRLRFTYYPAGRGLADEEDVSEFVVRTGLSPRELDVLRALVEGISNRQIGEMLGLQEVTVKLHLRRIYKKVGVSNRTQAVKLAMENGIR